MHSEGEGGEGGGGEGGGGGGGTCLFQKTIIGSVDDVAGHFKNNNNNNNKTTEEEIKCKKEALTQSLSSSLPPCLPPCLLPPTSFLSLLISYKWRLDGSCQLFSFFTGTILQPL